MEQRKRILAVDDSGLNLRSIKNSLEEFYDVDCVNSGSKAILKFRNKAYDLIILDYEMPIFSGVDVYNQIKSHEDTANIPIIFLTGVSDRERVVKILSFHPEGYLLKPINPKMLLEKVREILEET